MVPQSLSLARATGHEKHATPKVRWRSYLLPFARDPVFDYCIDIVFIDDLLENEAMWAVFNDKGMLLTNRQGHPDSVSLKKAIALATDNANKRFPRVSVLGKW